jgi:zinc protease
MIRTALFFLLSFLCCAVNAGTWQSKTLTNGLQVFVREDHRAPVALVNVWYRVGSADEVVGKTGLSHMLEHMMFQGTTLHVTGEYARMISERGGRYNAFTTADFTAYFNVVNRDDLSLVLDLESDRMVNLTFDQTLFDKEREVVMEERRMRIEDQPRELFAEHFNQVAYGKSPYASPTIGWEEDIQAYELQDYKTWYQKWYSPQNAILMIVGDVNTEEVFTMVEEKFSSLENAAAKPEPTQDSSETHEKSSFEMRQKTEVPLMMLGYSAPSLTTTTEEYIPYALLLLQSYLAGNEDGLLVRTLVKDQGLATRVEVSYDPLARFNTLFELHIVPVQGTSFETLQKSIAQVIGGLQDQAITAEELRRIKVQFRAEFIYQQDQLSEQVEWLGRILIAHQSPDLSTQFLSRIEAVTAEQIQGVLRRYCTDKNVTQGILKPASSISKEEQG